MNPKFYTLPEEKQERIIRAAYEVFAKCGYKKASMSEIASAGEISKSLLFHYFRNKKELYLYLWKKVNSVSVRIETEYCTETEDFLEMIWQKVLARGAFMRRYPMVYLFSIRALLEEEREIQECVRIDYEAGYCRGLDEMMEKADCTKFRPGIDVRLLCQQIDWIMMTYLRPMVFTGKLEPEQFEKDFRKMIEQWKIAYTR